VRLFVAVWPPPSVVAMLSALPRPAVEGVRWTTPAQWHVTLRFLGEADPASVGPLPDVAGRAVSLGGATARLGRHVLMVPVQGLDDVVDGGRPHLTLARAKRGMPASLVGVPVEGSWCVDRVTLVASETHPDGARYTVLDVTGDGEGA